MIAFTRVLLVAFMALAPMDNAQGQRMKIRRRLKDERPRRKESSKKKKTFSPTTTPSSSAFPSDAPSLLPTTMPSFSAIPSNAPSETPTNMPSVSAAPSFQPSISQVPSAVPSPAPSTSRFPSTEPSTSAIPSGAPSVMPSAHPSVSSAPSLFACNTYEDDAPGYVMSDGSLLMPGYYATCVYEPNKGEYKSKCIPAGEELRDGDTFQKYAVHDCGCCWAGVFPPVPEKEDFCVNLGVNATSTPLSCLENVTNVCDTEIGDDVKVEYCVYDTQKEENKTKCKDPFDFESKDGKYEFQNCGACT